MYKLRSGKEILMFYPLTVSIYFQDGSLDSFFANAKEENSSIGHSEHSYVSDCYLVKNLLSNTDFSLPSQPFAG